MGKEKRVKDFFKIWNENKSRQNRLKWEKMVKSEYRNALDISEVVKKFMRKKMKMFLVEFGYPSYPKKWVKISENMSGWQN